LICIAKNIFLYEKYAIIYACPLFYVTHTVRRNTASRTKKTEGVLRPSLSLEVFSIPAMEIFKEGERFW
jgi:hypothetical protein